MTAWFEIPCYLKNSPLSFIRYYWLIPSRSHWRALRYLLFLWHDNTWYHQRTVQQTMQWTFRADHSRIQETIKGQGLNSEEHLIELVLAVIFCLKWSAQQVSTNSKITKFLEKQLMNDDQPCQTF
jgi:hypothetical protein